jgi:hypothetical protein
MLDSYVDYSRAKYFTNFKNVIEGRRVEMEKNNMRETGEMRRRQPVAPWEDNSSTRGSINGKRFAQRSALGSRQPISTPNNKVAILW